MSNEYRHFVERMKSCFVVCEWHSRIVRASTKPFHVYACESDFSSFLSQCVSPALAIRFYMVALFISIRSKRRIRTVYKNVAIQFNPSISLSCDMSAVKKEIHSVERSGKWCPDHISGLVEHL